MRILLFCLCICVCVFSYSQSDTGKCSYYHDKFHGRNTASGEPYNKYAFTAAHPKFPFNTYVKITNLSNGKSVVVRINDRGPNTGSRTIDVSRAAAEELDMIRAGIINAAIEVTSEEPPPPKRPVTGQKSEKTNNQKSVITGKITNSSLQEAFPTGWGVQTGFYKNISYCQSACKTYETKYNCPAYILVKSSSEGQNYRLVMGAFAEQKDAVLLKDKIAKDIKGCFLIKWAEL